MPKHHEPLCPVARWPKSHFMFCHCNLIREVQKAERERNALLIEEQQHMWPPQAKVALEVVAHLIRTGGSDE